MDSNHQDLMKNDIDGDRIVCKTAFQTLWPRGTASGKTLVIVAGAHGAFVITEDDVTPSELQIELVPADPIENGEGKNWLGCGDIFRAEFISSTLNGLNTTDATRRACQAAGDKIKRMKFLP